jgi:hypothetical protein
VRDGFPPTLRRIERLIDTFNSLRNSFHWAVAPFAESTPKESLRFTLEAARKHLSTVVSIGGNTAGNH